MQRKQLLIIFCFLLCGQLFSQLGKRHWLPPIHSRSADDVEDHYIYLSTPFPDPITVSLSYGNTTLTRTISAGNPSRIFISDQKPSEMFTADSQLNIPTNTGIRLVSTEDFYVSFRVRSQAQAGYLTTKGEEALGTSFRLGSLPQSSETVDKNFFVAVMATEDNTTVIFSDYENDVVFEGPNPPTGNTVTAVLQNGESYALSGYTTTSGNYDGFIGALVSSDKPIAVNTGNALGGFQGNTRDYTIDQIVPVEDVGNEYIVVEGNGNSVTERPMVIATAPNTRVFVNGQFYETLLNPGDYTLVSNNLYQGTSHRNMYITSSENVYVYQYLAGDVNEATVGMNFIPPLSCFFQKEVDMIPDIDTIGSTRYEGDLIITTRTGSILSVNGNAVTGSPENVVGTSDWVTYRLNGYQGNTRISSTGPLAVGIFGYNGSAGFGGYYSGFGTIPKDSETVVCQEGLTDLFDLLDGNPDIGGTWTGPNMQSHSGFFDPDNDNLGVYNYYLDTGCEVVDVNLTVTAIIPVRNPGESNQINLCREDGLVALFPFLLGAPELGGEWRTLEGEVFNGEINVNEITSTKYTYGFYDNQPCDAEVAEIQVEVSSAPDGIEINREGPFISNELATIQVTAIGGLGQYEYQIDNGEWQQNTRFGNIGSGNHLISVRDMNGCGNTISGSIFTLIYPSFFTPNGDGINDFWNIQDVETVLETPIVIYDRYGRLLTQLNLEGNGWDGRVNGQILPENDYWFQFTYREEGSSKVFKSHFTLKR